MKNYKHKTGLTLVEMLIVVAIIVILTTIVIGIAARIDDQSKEQLTESTIAILTAALRQFRDYEYRYKDLAYVAFDFPLDCNGFDVPGLQITLPNVLGAASVLISGGTHLNEYSGSEVLYFFLSRIPECRRTLDKIDESLITNEGSNKLPMNITITYPSGTTKVYPLLRFIDPWETALRYDYYYEQIVPPDPRQKRTFPVITSAGPDKTFGTADDISSR